MLYERGLANGVELVMIDQQELKAIDPNINTYKKALLSPTTATVDPKQVSQKLKSLLQSCGVVFHFNEKVCRFIEYTVQLLTGGLSSFNAGGILYVGRKRREKKGNDF